MEYRASKANFLHAVEGNFSLVLALCLLPLMFAGGLAVDYSRMSNARSVLQLASDAAALEASIQYSRGATTIDTQSKKFLRANVEPEDYLTIDRIVVTRPTADRVRVEAEGHIAATFTALMGKTDLKVSVSSEANLGKTLPVEVALVVDNSYSLAIYGAWHPLVDALKSFRDEIGKGGPDLGNLYISFIPFSGPVNVGPERTAWLSSLPGTTFSPGTWSGCVMARAGGADETDAPPTGSNRFAPYLWPSEVLWNNWAEEPDASNFQDIRLVANMGRVELGPNSGCNNKLGSLSNRLSDLKAAIDLYETTIATKNGTFPVQAFAWGHRTISPKWMGLWGGPTPKTLPSSDGKKFLIFLSDGEPQWNKLSRDPANPGHYSAYGWADANRLDISDPRNGTLAADEMARRFNLACDSAKANNITVIAIGYAMSVENAAYMKDCASGASNFYESVPTSQIEAVFKKIAKEVLDAKNVPRLTQ